MPRYHRLTLAQRYQIVVLRNSGLSLRSIAKSLKCNASTISREMRRNSIRGYSSQAAHRKYLERRKGVGPPFKIVGRLEKRILSRLSCQWSPEQIAGRMGGISCESIYRYVYRKYAEGNRTLYLNLRRHRKRRWSKRVGRAMAQCGRRLSYPSISDRPKVVEKRMRLGDWERDGLLGKRNGPLLLSHVDRVSKILKLGKISELTAHLAHLKTVKLLSKMPVRTITNDNGPEFADYQKTKKKLQAKIFFSDPYSSWQRGTNENTNGLIRQYFPKGTDFKRVPNREIKRVEDLLNNRPRKKLGFKTPYEVQRKKCQGVALRC